MPSPQTTDLHQHLQQGKFVGSDVAYLEGVKANDLLAELERACPVRFQEHRLGRKWEIALAHRAELRIQLRGVNGTWAGKAELVPVFAHCLFLSGEGDSVTGVSFLSTIRLRRKSSNEVALRSGRGYKLSRFPDGWEGKALVPKVVKLDDEFLRRRGWRMHHVPPVAAVTRPQVP